MLQKFAMVKYGVFVAKICKHALRASAVRDIWWSPLARQLLPPCRKLEVGARRAPKLLVLDICDRKMGQKYCVGTLLCLPFSPIIPQSTILNFGHTF